MLRLDHSERPAAPSRAHRPGGVRWIARALVCLTGAGLALCFAHGSARAQNPFLQASANKTIRQINIFGNHVTQEYVLRRELGFQEGDPYDAEQIASAWERLEKLDFIAYVDIQEKQPSPTDVILVIQVEEDLRLGFSPAINYDDAFGGFSVGGRMVYKNLRGRAEDLELDASVGKQDGVRLRWSNPWVLGGAHLGLSLAGWWQYHDFGYEPFRLDEPAGQVTLWRDVSRWVRVSTSFTYRNERISHSDSPEFPNDTVADAVAGFRLEHDSRDLRYYPRRGAHVIGEVRWGGLGSAQPYSTYEGLAAGFVPLPIIGILAGRADYRESSTRLPVYERAYVGGAETLRGIEVEDAQDGDASWLATVELRKALFLLPLREGRTVGVGVHAFHDWGKTWDHGSSFDDGGLRWAFGLGAHVNINVANVRFEWARNDRNDDSFVFEDRFTF